MTTGSVENRPLGEIADFKAGNTLPDGVAYTGQSDGYLLLKVGDLNSPGNQISVSSARSWSAHAGPVSSTCRAGAIVFPKRGGAISTNKKRVLSRPAVLDPNLMGVEPLPDKLLSSYLRHWFERLNLATLISGSAVPQLNKKDLAPLKVPLPPLAEQRRIADILDKADAIRRKRKEAIALTEDLLRSAFLDMFGDPVTNPKGWPVRSVTELCESKQYGTAAKANSDGRGQPVLRMNNLTYAGDIDTADIKWVELEQREATKLDLQDGDVLFNRVNSHELVGKTAAWHGGEGYTFAGYLIRLRMDQAQAVGDYVSAAMNTPSIKRELLLMAKPSINMANISGSDLDRLRIPVPPIAEQSRYKGLRCYVEAQRRRQRDALQASEELFGSLVSQAFSGHLNGASAC